MNTRGHRTDAVFPGDNVRARASCSGVDRAIQRCFLRQIIRKHPDYKYKCRQRSAARPVLWCALMTMPLADLFAGHQRRSDGAPVEQLCLQERCHRRLQAAQQRQIGHVSGVCRRDRARRRKRRCHDKAVHRRMILGYQTPEAFAARRVNPTSRQATGQGAKVCHAAAPRPFAQPPREGQNAASKGGRLELAVVRRNRSGQVSRDQGRMTQCSTC